MKQMKQGIINHSLMPLEALEVDTTKMYEHLIFGGGSKQPTNSTSS